MRLNKTTLVKITTSIEAQMLDGDGSMDLGELVTRVYTKVMAQVNQRLKQPACKNLTP
jgi:hypothetical protein